MTSTRSTQLLAIAEREAFEATAKAHATLRERAEMAMRLDAIELELVFSHQQTAPVHFALQQQGGDLAARARGFLDQLDDRFSRLQQCIHTPPRTATMGRSWMAEIDKIDDMIGTARTLLDLPNWRGTAAEAHLAVVPQQIEAMEVLRAQAVTASESVIAVGALQNTIFEACTLLMLSTAMQVDVQEPGGHVPQALYRRTSGLVILLDRLLIEVDKQITGHGTWLESAQQLSRGLEEASTGHGFEWPRAVRWRRDDPRGSDDTDTPGDATEAVSDAEPAVDEEPTATGDTAIPEEDPMLVESPVPEVIGLPGGETATPGPPPESEPDPTSPFEADPAPTPDPGVIPDPGPPSQPGPQPEPDVPTPSVPAGSLPVEPMPDDNPAPPEEPTPAPELTPTEDPTPPAPPPTDVATDEAWEQIAKDRALAEEALFPPPVHREPVGIGGHDTAQMLR